MSVIAKELAEITCAEIALRSAKQDLKEAHAKLGMALRLSRQARSISLREMGRRIGCTAVYVSDCERGNRHFSPELREAYLAELKKG